MSPAIVCYQWHDGKHVFGTSFIHLWNRKVTFLVGIVHGSYLQIFIYLQIYLTVNLVNITYGNGIEIWTFKKFADHSWMFENYHGIVYVI